MAWLTSKFKETAQDSVEAFMLVVLMLVFAVSLSFLEDFCRTYHRPAWLLLGLEGTAMLAFGTDLVVFASICAKLVARAIHDTVLEMKQLRQLKVERDRSTL